MVAAFLLAAGFAVMVPMLTGMSTWQAILYLFAVPFLYQALMILDLLMGWGFVGEDIHRPEVSRWRCAACWSQGMEEVAAAVSLACIVGAVVGFALDPWAVLGDSLQSLQPTMDRFDERAVYPGDPEL